ncbi:MAG: Fis family transcriptional regulator, partial [Desulfobacteraceae bacterium]|nr:Fis family transcriptional regulator [Desulfobacteraceae bacterium]
SLYKYDYPGNVRELQNILRRFIATGKLEFLGRDPAAGQEIAVPNGSLAERLETYEKEILENCLIQNLWHRGRTAAALGIDRKTLFTRMKQYGLNFPKTG